MGDGLQRELFEEAAPVIDEQIGVADAQAPRSNDGNRVILTLLVQLDINISNVRIMRAVKQNGKCSCKSRRIKVASVVHQHRHVQLAWVCHVNSSAWIAQQFTRRWVTVFRSESDQQAAPKRLAVRAI